jgi:hypothetical protein
VNQIGATVKPSTTIVTIGAGERQREVALRVFPGDGLVTVSTVGEQPQFVGTVSALNLRKPQFRVDAAFIVAFNRDDRKEVREKSDQAYQGAQAAMRAAASEPEGPPTTPPGPGTKYIVVDGLRIAFTPCVEHRTVTLHTGIGSPRYIGQARNLGDDDADTKLCFKDLWGGRFGDPGPSQDITEAAGNIWRAARDGEGAT